MTDSNPPVGATVVDGRGYAWRFAEDALWHWIVGNGVQITVGVQPSDHESALTALWRMQRCAEAAEAERDALAAQLAAARAGTERLMGVIRGAANAGVQEDSCLSLRVELTMDRRDWNALVDAARGGA